MAEQLAVFIDFENVALWAERDFLDFNITKLMEYLQARGPAVVKRAYGDWSRFSRYREDLLDNSIDLIQIYSVRQGKNRADIRMAIDAFEIALTRLQIATYVIVSGDSDFGPLVTKLREYGKYTIGIGPRSITHHLLVKSFDEFVYLETALGEQAEEDEQVSTEKENARNLLVKAVQAHGQRGELPVLATRLKQTMLLMDPAFNEANFGYTQFKMWLDDSRDLVKLYNRDLQLYVAPANYTDASAADMTADEPSDSAVEYIPPARPSIEMQYRQLFSRLKMTNIDLSTRRDVLRDVYRELSDPGRERTTDELLDELHDRYEALNLGRSKAALRDILQLAFRQWAFDYHDQAISLHSPVYLASGIDSEAAFVQRAEADFVFAAVRAGLEIQPSILAGVILNDNAQEEYILCLLEELKSRGQIVRKGKLWVVSGQGRIPFLEEPALHVLREDMDQVIIPSEMSEGVEMAHNLAKKAMLQRSQDFAASGTTYLMACRLQRDAVEKGEQSATVEDLRWFLASYASAMAGKLSQVNRDYLSARPYYLAFFALVQEDDPLWSRMRGLINPMLAYYWFNAGRELDLNISSWTQSMSSPAQIAVYAATYPNAELRRLWQKLTVELAQVNPYLLRRIASQLRLSAGEFPENGRVAETIENVIAQAGD